MMYQIQCEACKATCWVSGYHEHDTNAGGVYEDRIPPPEEWNIDLMFEPEFRTEAVVALIRAFEAEGERHILPILADALEDAGYPNVAHLRLDSCSHDDFEYIDTEWNDHDD